MLVLHYTGMIDAASALARLTDPAAKVSAHYVIDEDGTIHRLVAEDRRAWHAGDACWRGATDINGRSIGIELVNPGHAFGYRPFPEVQVRAVIDLGLALVGRHPIPARNVVGHADVAPRRKEDPGELFDWRRLADHGLGLWPRQRPVTGELGLALGPGDGDGAAAALQGALADFGYDVPTHGGYDTDTEAVVRAFQRHFRPARVDGRADPETAQLAFALQAMIG
ncbi:MAG: N-acetylmuramoyl-L-alanine amidase [Alphaproteobacteria bacterium]|nr:N-acetylmuramoyl-L-alanine amidase [Alphaproteobacteria bacterium]